MFSYQNEFKTTICKIIIWIRFQNIKLKHESSTHPDNILLWILAGTLFNRCLWRFWFVLWAGSSPCLPWAATVCAANDMWRRHPVNRATETRHQCNALVLILAALRVFNIFELFLFHDGLYEFLRLVRSTKMTWIYIYIYERGISGYQVLPS